LEQGDAAGTPEGDKEGGSGGHGRGHGKGGGDTAGMRGDAEMGNAAEVSEGSDAVF
jgi:hypothetical protein